MTKAFDRENTKGFRILSALKMVEYLNQKGCHFKLKLIKKQRPIYIATFTKDNDGVRSYSKNISIAIEKVNRAAYEKWFQKDMETFQKSLATNPLKNSENI